MPNAAQRDLTDLLVAWRGGDETALAELMPRVYRQLKRMAAGFLSRERADHTLQPTELVHEVYMRLVDLERIDWRERVHFLSVCARLMRRVLVERARYHGRAKRGQGVRPLSFEALDEPVSAPARDRALWGDEHPVVAETLVALADVVLLQGEADAAQVIAEQALAIARRRAGDDPATLVRALDGLVSVLCARREYPAAEPLASEALELAEQLPVEDLQRAYALVDMAAVRRGLGDLAAAVELDRRGLAILRAVLGKQHPKVMTVSNNLGAGLRRLGRLEEAEQVFGEVIAAIRATLGESHPKLAPTLNNLGGVLQEQGRFAEARERFSETLAIVRGATPDDPLVFFLELRVQEMRIELGEVETAVAVLRPALERWRGRLGDGHRWIVRGAAALALAEEPPP